MTLKKDRHVVGWRRHIAHMCLLVKFEYTADGDAGIQCMIGKSSNLPTCSSKARLGVWQHSNECTQQ